MDRRVRILRAALEVFSSEGFNGASLSRIAERAGTNKQLVNHHFGSKQNLWREVVDFELQDGIELIRRVRDTEQAEGPLPALTRFIDEYVAWVSTKTAIQKVILLESQQRTPRLDWLTEAHLVPSAKVVMRLIRGCQEIGAVKTGRAGQIYFTVLQIAGAPFVNAYQYRLYAGSAPGAKSAIEYHRTVIADFLGLRAEPVSDQPAIA